MIHRPSIAALMTMTIALAGAVHAAGAAETLSYADLVARLVDLEQPALLPLPGETCKQWSSWDRASQYDAARGKYVNWAANNDGPFFIREEDGRFVMAEMDGPGCIWRIWSARALDGRVKVYLDGGKEPAIDLPFKNYFSGDTAPLAYPALSYDLAEHGCRGQNLYLPIPYQKSCKIVAEKDWGRYYQFVYTTYPAGTKVPTFSTELAAENAPLLKQVNDRCAGRIGGKAEGLPDGPGAERKSVRVDGETTVRVAELAGPRMITSIQARVPLGDRDDQMAALRQLCLQITFDGEEKPAVWCPLGDFFGTAPGRNDYTNWVTGMTEDGFYANWVMPFGKRALVELVNDGNKARDVELKIVSRPLGRPFEGMGHFHCKWHRDAHRLPEDRWPDWVMLKTEGRGRFLGVMLHVWNPRGGWWGEGDEKFFVDGEKFPSTFGTGSEDYFGYAWCDPGLFQRPFHAQTMTMGNKGHQSVLRWQISDNVPFQTSFEGTIEKYYRTEEKGTLYASTVCWYLAPGGMDPYDPVPVKDRHGYYVKPPAIAGGFRVLGDPAGDPQTQKMTNFSDKWTNGDQLWWTGAKPGDKLEVALSAKAEGRRRVSVILTKARDYAVVRLSLDGKPLGEPIDLYNPTVIRTEPIPLGTVELAGAEHVLGVEIVGKNEKAVPSYMFGLDEVLLEKVE